MSLPSLPTLLWLALLALTTFAAGVVAVRFAFRGRAVDDHPICRACGYDLHGLERDCPFCPECGARLGTQAAVRIGHRRVRPKLMAAGVVLGLAGLIAMTVMGVVGRRALRVEANQPTWWLTHRLGERWTPAQVGPFKELYHRLALRELSAKRVAAVVDDVLAWQADATVRWDIEWGDFVEMARRQGRLDDAQWGRYARQGVVFDWRTRRPVRRGEEIQSVISTGYCRFGGGPCFTLEYRIEYRLDGHRLGGIERPYLSDLGPGMASSCRDNLTIPSEALASLPDGPHALEADIGFEVYDRSGRPHPLPPRAAWHERRRMPCDLVPADTETVKLVRSPTVLAEGARKISVRRVRYDGRLLWVWLTVNRLSTDFAANVYVRAGGREWLAANATARAGIPDIAWANVMVGKFDAKCVDVIVRASAPAARTTLDITRRWGGELVFKDAPVSRTKPARPTAGTPTTKPMAARP